MITVRDMINEMLMNQENGQPQPFNIEFVKYDERKKTAGKIKSLQNCILVAKPAQTKHTINILALNDRRHPIVVHTNFIIKFNDKRVI